MKSRLAFIAFLALAARAVSNRSSNDQNYWNNLDFNKYIDSTDTEIPDQSYWNYFAKYWNELLNYWYDYFFKNYDKEKLKIACAAAGGVAGAFTPAAFYAALGLSSTGPVAGGIFAWL